MENETKNKIISMSIFLLIVVVMQISVFSYYSPSDLEKWCERNKPVFNISLDSERVKYCYGEGWVEYCKIRSPQNCPNNHYTDEERRIMNNQEIMRLANSK